MNDKERAKAGRTAEGELLKMEEEISRLEAEIDGFLLRQRIFSLNLEALKGENFD